MHINWVNNLPDKPQDFINFSKNFLKLPLEEALKLYYITLKLRSMSDSPIYKFLERLPYGIKFDEIKKREYLITFSIHILRQLLKEHFDLKLVKNLYLLLSEKLPKSFLKGVIPKHSILASQDIIVEIMAQEDKNKLPAFLKAKHIILILKLTGTCEEIVSTISYFTNPYILINQDEKYTIFVPFSISELVLFSLNIKQKKLLGEINKILDNIKTLFPDCFGEI